MIRKTIFVVYFYIFTSDLIAASDERHKLNVILFFAKVENIAEIPNEPQALKCLGLTEKAKIKHDAILDNEEGSTNNVKESEAPTCHELLKNGVINLIHYGQDKLKMKTAIASVDPQHIAEAISNDEPQVAPELKSEPGSEKKIRRKTYYGTNSKKKEDTIPAFVTKPKHTEVFNIRVRKHQNRGKRQDTPKQHEIADVSLEKHSNKHPWDVLDVVSHVRYSFFNNVLGNHTKHHTGHIENGPVENTLPEETEKLEELGQKEKDPGLFGTVSSALATFQDSADGFIMVIFGGHLNSVSILHSPLVQSIKHVTENTDPNNTIIVLTASCPEPTTKPENGQVVIQEVSGPAEHVIPVFAKGPYSERFAECTDLDDVPLIVKNILKKNSEKNGKGTCNHAIGESNH